MHKQTKKLLNSYKNRGIKKTLNVNFTYIHRQGKQAFGHMEHFNEVFKNYHLKVLPPCLSNLEACHVQKFCCYKLIVDVPIILLCGIKFYNASNKQIKHTTKICVDRPCNKINGINGTLQRPRETGFKQNFLEAKNLAATMDKEIGFPNKGKRRVQKMEIDKENVIT